MSLMEFPCEVSFADAEFIAFNRIGDSLIVHIKTWDDKLADIRFRDAVAVRDCLPGDIAGFYQHDTTTEYLDSVMHNVYSKPPDKYPYQHYAFLNLDDAPSLEVVAQNCTIVVT